METRKKKILKRKIPNAIVFVWNREKESRNKMANIVLFVRHRTSSLLFHCVVGLALNEQNECHEWTAFASFSKKEKNEMKIVQYSRAI